MRSKVNESQGCDSPNVKITQQGDAWCAEITQEGRAKIFTRPNESLEECLEIAKEKVQKLTKIQLNE